MNVEGVVASDVAVIPDKGCAFQVMVPDLGSVIDIFANNKINHHVSVDSGLLADECGGLLTQFFKEKRKQYKTITNEVEE